MITVKDTPFYTAKHWELLPQSLLNRKGIFAKAKSLNFVAKGYVVVQGDEHTMPSVGFYEESEGFSLEATIASTSQEKAIFVIQTDHGSYKLFLTDRNMILSGSGFEGALEDVISEIDGSARMVLPTAKVYCSDPVACSISPEWESIDLERIINFESKVPIEEMHTRSRMAKPMAIAAVALVVGIAIVFGWQMAQKKSGPTISKEQQEAEAKRRMFLAEQTRLLDQFREKSSSWIVDVANQINDKYAVNGFGWSFTGADCTRSSCKLIWSSSPSQNAYYSPFIKMVRINGVDTNVTGTKLSINNNSADINAELKLPSPDWINLSSDASKIPLANAVRDRLWDFKQVMDSRYGIKVQPSKSAEKNLVPGTVPPGVIVVYKKGELSATGETVAQLFYFASALDSMGLYAQKFVYSPGTSSKIKQQWKVEASYVTR